MSNKKNRFLNDFSYSNRPFIYDQTFKMFFKFTFIEEKSTIQITAVRKKKPNQNYSKSQKEFTYRRTSYYCKFSRTSFV
jgi:hypothetical protein